MTIHLIKLCVGCDSVSDLEDWIKLKLKEKKRRGQKAEHIHTTRMVPKRAAELAIVVSCWCTLPAAPETVVPFPLSTAVPGIDASDAHAAQASTATIVKVLMRRR